MPEPLPTDPRCEECRESRGYNVIPALPGVLINAVTDKQGSRLYVERCDLCDIYPSDKAALDAVIAKLKNNKE